MEIVKRKRDPVISSRVKQLKAMDAFIESINDEGLIDSWLAYGGVPDEVREEQLVDIAGDKEAYAQCVSFFKRIVKSDNWFH